MTVSTSGLHLRRKQILSQENENDLPVACAGGQLEHRELVDRID